MLDLLPEEIWHDSTATFLDPACKSGVFLREIAKRLIGGLEDEFPDLQERLDHIFKEQLFAIAITELTSLLSRRSTYCSKYPNSKYSVVEFDEPEGNIRFRNTEHTWYAGRCKYCGASQKEYEREDNLEAYAYEFIHFDTPEEICHMKFDVIIGNPPYQLSDGGAQKSAGPIYQYFIKQAMKLNPKYLTMIVPARWYSGGKGLDEFREDMLNCRKVVELHDFPETSDCFPGVNIRGGICYFLWSREYSGDCLVVNHQNGRESSKVTRPLKEKGATTLIRWNEAIAILKKVQNKKETTMDELVSARKPFGLPTNFNDYSTDSTADNNILLRRFGKNGWIAKDAITKNSEWIDKWKVFEPYASPGSDDYPHLVLSRPIVAGPGEACTETYLVIGPFKTENEANNAASYMKTQFFRFMLLLLKSTQHVTQKVYAFVPKQDFAIAWTDHMLYEKYGITSEEIDFINTLIKPLNESSK